MKSRTFDEVTADLFTEEERREIEAEAARLIAEDKTLQELRKAKQMTQVELAEAMGCQQTHLSRLEKKTDLMLSTIRRYVEAMGGRLNLVVEFPDSPAVSLTGFGDTEEPPEGPAPRETVAKPSKRKAA